MDDDTYWSKEKPRGEEEDDETNFLRSWTPRSKLCSTYCDASVETVGMDHPTPYLRGTGHLALK